MKKFLMTAAIAILCASCSNNDWKDDFSTIESELTSIKNELANQNRIIETLKNQVSILGIEDHADGYSIKFSNGQTIELSHGKTPKISIGANGNWIIDGIDTQVCAAGENGQTPTISISTSGTWIMNGVDTGIRAEGLDGKPGQDGADGKEAPIITRIVETQTNFIFYLSDGTNITSIKNRVIVFWGDSLTAGAHGDGTTMPSTIQDFLGDRYCLVNAGIGGENSLTIGARQGGNTMTIKEDITLSAVPSTIHLVDYHGNRITPLLQGGPASINPCYINGIECTMKWTGNLPDDPNGKWTLESTNNIKATQIR